MTWRGERRKQLPPDWPARRLARLELDGYRCTTMLSPVERPLTRTEIDELRRLHAGGEILTAQRLIINATRCPARATDVHHAGQADDHRVDALRSLCAHHHQLETQAEAQAARGVGPLRLRPKRPHPGLIDIGDKTQPEIVTPEELMRRIVGSRRPR